MIDALIDELSSVAYGSERSSTFRAFAFSSHFGATDFHYHLRFAVALKAEF